jgi:hypothetical protein
MLDKFKHLSRLAEVFLIFLGLIMLGLIYLSFAAGAHKEQTKKSLAGEHVRKKAGNIPMAA